MTTVFDSYHRLAGEAFDAWDRLLVAPDCPDARAALVAAEDRLDHLEPDLRAALRACPSRPPGEWPSWLLEMAGEDGG